MEYIIKQLNEIIVNLDKDIYDNYSKEQLKEYCKAIKCRTEAIINRINTTKTKLDLTIDDVEKMIKEGETNE